ncbi:MAG TPA: hypothetical protein PLB63_11760 [Planctomycetota bacterium]|nr:hypothetical protein [Planctomycetota bacterium]
MLWGKCFGESNVALEKANLLWGSKYALWGNCSGEANVALWGNCSGEANVALWGNCSGEANVALGRQMLLWGGKCCSGGIALGK